MRFFSISLALVAFSLATETLAQTTPTKPRARDLGIATQIGGTPGALDAITDVPGLEVGQTTLISGSGALVVGQGPVRTGVTVIHPRGKDNVYTNYDGKFRNELTSHQGTVGFEYRW